MDIITMAPEIGSFEIHLNLYIFHKTLLSIFSKNLFTCG